MLRVTGDLPPDLPLGYHELRPLDGRPAARLIVAPARCHLPDGLRIWGWAIQLYALRSRESWGIGDLADLRRLADWSASELGAGAVVLNPLHAPLPLVPQEPSPYFPSSRRYRNPLYLRVEEVPGAAEARLDVERLAAQGRALNAERRIDRDAVFRLKMTALDALWRRGRGHWPGSLATVPERAGDSRSSRPSAPSPSVTARDGGAGRPSTAIPRRPRSRGSPPSTRERVGVPRVAPVAARRAARSGRASAAPGDRSRHRLRRRGGRRLGVAGRARPGRHGGSAPRRLRARRAGLGSAAVRAAPASAPPATGRSSRRCGPGLRHAGGMRVDHVMGLFRLFWVPGGATARDGAYVRYPTDDLLAILALESERAGAIVIGEDLGTVAPGVRERPRRRADPLDPRALVRARAARRATRRSRSRRSRRTTSRPCAASGPAATSGSRRPSGMPPNVAGTEALRARLRELTGVPDDASSER